MQKDPLGGYPIKSFKTQAEWRAWLSKNYAKQDGVWIRMFKKATGKPTVNHAQGIDEALCFGWIDGQSLSHDDESWLQKFTPRRKRSPWSKINVGHAMRLIKEKKMKSAGLKQIEEAKKDGRWELAYHSSRNAEMPADFLKALAKDKKAKAFFDTLNNANRYAIFYRLTTAKKPETRKRRFDLIMDMLAKGQKFH